jgi:enediyne biosynthesis protein E4
MKPFFAVLGSVLGLVAQAALAGPSFIDRASALETIPVYEGDWEHFVGGGVAILDCNGDAKPDLFVAGGTSPASLLLNTSKTAGLVTFSDAKIAPITGVTGAYPLDVDSDGYQDLVVLRVGPDLVLKGDGTCHFSDVSDVWGLSTGDHWSTAFTATWEAGQDWPTLALGHYVDRARPDGPFEACDDNHLYRPKPGGGYAAPVKLSPGYCALSMLFSDWKRDGVADLRISNDRHYYVRGGYEEMWRMTPLAPYEAAEWPRFSLWGMGIASRDITGDGLPEVMMTSMGDQLLQINLGQGKLANAPYGIGTYAQIPYVGDDGRPSTGWHAEFGDIDNDGRDDLFIAKGNVDQMPSNAMADPNNLLMQGPDGTFTEAGGTSGIGTTHRSRGAGLADLNGDGLLDIVVVNRRAGLEIWQNTTQNTGNWLGVALHQDQSNRNAVGAWVELRHGDQTWAQEVTVGGGHVSGHAGPLHFGLGTADKVEARVIWPGGVTSDWLSLSPNQTVTLGAEGSALILR